MIYYITESTKKKLVKVKLDIYGKKFNLNVHYRAYSGEEITEGQYITALSFEKNANINATLNRLRDYIIEDSEYIDPDNKIDSIDDIFEYVNPKTLFIPRIMYKPKELNGEKNRYAAILFDYTLDEHGIALVFKNERLISIGSQDIII